MRKSLLIPACVSLPLAVGASGAFASPNEQVTTFAVMRNDSQIGTDTVRVDRVGSNRTVQETTHVEVKLGFITLYRFDQTEQETWAGDRLLMMKATTDDNGTVHKAEASSSNGSLVLNCDGRANTLGDDVVPFNPWNADLLGKSTAFDPANGHVLKVSVTDRGEEALLVRGRSVRAHHYIVNATLPQNVWYDDAHRLVKLEFKGSDGSTISYQLA